MKKSLLTLALLAFITIACGQSTWMQRISYNLVGTFMHPDSACGIQDISISPDGNLYMVGKVSQSNTKEVIKMTPGTHTILWSEEVAYESTLHGDDNSFVRATVDSGCILAINFHGYVATNWEATTIIKYSKNGVIQWRDSVGFNDTSSNYFVYRTNDIIQNAAGNYYALLTFYPGNDSLFEYDNSGAIIFRTKAVHGNRLFEMSNGDLVVHQTNYTFNDSLVRINLSGNIIWGVPTYRNDLFAFSASAAFICHKDTGASLSVIKSIDVNTGTITWTDTVPASIISTIDATSDGGVIASEGLIGEYYAPLNMTGKLYKIDNNGNAQWTHSYPFPVFGLSTVKQYPDGRYITGGTYHACDMYYLFEREYSGFAAMLDSSGNGDLQTASNIWPGDANGNDTLWLPEDALYMALALNSTGTPRDTIANSLIYPYPYFCFDSDYAIDWSQTFPNGTNYKHADLNGDGVVDVSDINMLLFLQVIWGPQAVNCRIPGETLSSSVPDLLLLPEQDSVAPGDLMRFFIIAGSSSQHVDSVFGISFINYYDVSLTDTSLVNINFFNNDFGNPAANLLSLSNQSFGQIGCVISRNDQQNVYQLYDTLGVIELKANTNITSPQIFNLQFSSLYAMTNSTSPVPFNAINGSVVIDPALVPVPENLSYTQNIYPVPADKFLVISNLPAGEKDIRVYNILGEKNKSFHTKESSLEISVSDLKSGVYNLVLSSKAGSRNLKFVVDH